MDFGQIIQRFVRFLTFSIILEKQHVIQIHSPSKFTITDLRHILMACDVINIDKLLNILFTYKKGRTVND